MTTSPETSNSATSRDDEALNVGELAYRRARSKSIVHDLVLKEFQKEGISRAQLARRLRKRPEQITRLLGGPGNWTLDTVSDLLFAISGGELAFAIRYPLDEATRNYAQPEWLTDKSLSWVNDRQFQLRNQAPESPLYLGDRKSASQLDGTAKKGLLEFAR